MTARPLRISGRSIALVSALASVMSLAIDAHAALSVRARDAAKAIATDQPGEAAKRASRIALVIGNSHYPDADAPLTQPINDARGSRPRCGATASTSMSWKTPARTT